jgi:murein L,D-transpeptidase YcbB/YkuD
VQVRPTDGVPVYLVYLTALIRDGEVAFRDDIYDRDDALIRALRARARTAGNAAATALR